MKPEIEIYPHISSGRWSAELEEKLSASAVKALELVLTVPQGPEHVLTHLDVVEISIVGDEAIAEVHARFLNDPAPTDVITFPHGDGLGEIIVSLDTALRQAAELGEEWERELFRYIVHGLLHLHGYLDASLEERDEMFSHQEPIVASCWSL